MEYRFDCEIVSHIPTCALIEDYQALMKAKLAGDWEEVDTVMECIANYIDHLTTVPAESHIRPSPSSIIAMSCKSGIILSKEEDDLMCAAGEPVSKALLGGVCQCDSTCMKRHGCDPESGVIQLVCGYSYDMSRKPTGDGELLTALDRYQWDYRERKNGHRGLSTDLSER